MTYVMQHANVRMIQTGNGLGFALEALLADGIIRKLSRQNLDRYCALQSRVSRSIHFPHAAGT